MEILRVENVTKTFLLEGQAVEALRCVSFSLDAGDAHVILGPSGSGKSTLLTLLGGLSSPSEGKVFFKGHSLYDLPAVKLARVRNRSFGFVFQFHHLLPELTALENVLLPGRIARFPEAECREKARRLLAQVGLERRLNHKPGELSGGERQRVAVARALLNEPEVLFADEPTGNLDKRTAAGVLETLWDLCQGRGSTLLVVTHDETLAKKADRVLTLDSGKLTHRRTID